jgi:ketosteroid isomerase-like protein
MSSSHKKMSFQKAKDGTHLQMDHHTHNERNAIASTLHYEQVDHWIAAFNAHDVEKIVELYTENAELFDSGMRYTRKGHHAIKKWFTQRFQQMPTIQYVPQNKFFNEKGAVVHWLAQGHTPPLLRQRWLMRPFEVDGVSIFSIENGLIIWQHGYYDHLQIIEKVLPPLRWLPLKL